MPDDLCSKCREPVFKSSSIIPTADDEARLVALLRSNLPPVDPLQVAKSWLQQSRAEMDRYDTEIARVQAALQKLLDERQSVAAQVQRYHGVYFSPIRRLPPELLVKIMHETLLERDEDDDPSMETETERLAHKPLLVLSEVCYTWHKTAFSTPQLWSNLRVDLALWTDANRQKNLHLVERSLARSGQFPLSIQLNSGLWEDDRLLVQLLLMHVSRWRSLEAELKPSTLRLIMASGLAALETIQLTLRHDHQFSTWERVSAMRLRSASFASFRPLELPPLPWPQLESFSYNAPELFTPANLLALPWQEIQLGASFSLTIRWLAGGWNQPLPEIDSRIGQLTLTTAAQLDSSVPGAGRHLLRAALQSFTMLHLHTLHLLGPENFPRPELAPTPFYAFTKRCNLATSLTTLALDVIISEPTLLLVLTGLPALEELSLCDPPTESSVQYRPYVAVIQDSLFRALHCRRGQNAQVSASTIIPRLRRLSLKTIGAFTDAALLVFLGSRIVSGFVLHVHRVGVPLNDALGTEFWVTVDGWIEDGILKLTYNESCPREYEDSV
ncbi:3-beta hydroxysteroid dehydrogenase isomerase family [Mycena kentingensis (nom. inval.)]|nr:3-beta hydroxysteroid dehydrogenase isomerase family [Mycena kentingensis (nom. inval.)]